MPGEGMREEEEQGLLGAGVKQHQHQDQTQGNSPIHLTHGSKNTRQVPKNSIIKCLRGSQPQLKTKLWL